jgi:hypothetical protein
VPGSLKSFCKFSRQFSSFSEILKSIISGGGFFGIFVSGTPGKIISPNMGQFSRNHPKTHVIISSPKKEKS